MMKKPAVLLAALNLWVVVPKLLAQDAGLALLWAFACCLVLATAWVRGLRA
jgi:hypothetical protein